MKCRVLKSGNCEITQEYKSGHQANDIVGGGYTLDYIVAHTAGRIIAFQDGLGNMKGTNSYGNYVIIDHGNGYSTLYAHMEKGLKVKNGQYVEKGQVLGYMGDTGSSYGGHLHFEVRKNNVKIDPTNYLNADLPSVSNNEVNVYYKVKTQKHGWLPEVKNLDDYAGWEGSPVTEVAIKVDKGSVKYRVHIKGGNWLPYVTGYDVNEHNNGYAGNGNVIDLVEVYYFTPNNIRPYKKAKYRVNDLPYQYDNETGNGQDGYAGNLGQAVTKFQIVIE